MMIFFSADHHFNHTRILDYCDRPFTDVQEMDDELIRRWNAVIPDNDIVYHLGDFTLSDKNAARRYFRQLNGQIAVLGTPWHHDRRWLPCQNVIGIAGSVPKVGLTDFFTATDSRVVILPPMHVLELPEYGDGKHPLVLVLCHYPLAVWDRRHYGSLHLHGHSHGRYVGEGHIMDVGVDSNDYRPVSLEEVVRRLGLQEQGDDTNRQTGRL